MRYILITLFVCFLSCKSDSNTNSELATNTGSNFNDELLIVDFNGLKPYLNKNDNKTYVINFWATWCAPCVKELPYFEELRNTYKEKNVEVILVSLDFPRKYETTLKPFIKDKNLKSKVIAFDDVDQNTWIPAIDESWSGAIPATIIYNKNNRKFYEQSFTYEELEQELKQFIN